MSQNFKKDFTFFNNNQDITYLDSAATSHRPNQVIEAANHFLEQDYATVSRGLYEKSVRATRLYEEVREKVCSFISAQNSDQIIFTSGATQAINLVAHSWGRTHLKAGDHIILSQMEHHANIVPWRLLADEIGFNIDVISLNKNKKIDLDHYKSLLKKKPKFVGCVHLSNVLGCLNPVKEMCELAKEVGAVTLIDGCQAVSYDQVNVTDMGCDFYVFSAHKIYGPTGMGVLYGSSDVLKEMPPFISGGDMIESVAFDKVSYLAPPHRFEAGTPNIEGVVGLGATLDYVLSIGMSQIKAHKDDLSAYMVSQLKQMNRVNMLGDEHCGLVSFVVEGLHVHDVGAMLANKKICIRAGLHCAQPLFDALGHSGSLRASIGVYNDKQDIDRFVHALSQTIDFFNQRGL